MVLESLTSPFSAEAHPRKMIFLGFLYISIAMFLATWIFKSQASLVMVFLATMAAVPLIYNTIQQEESKDMEGLGEVWLLKEHWKALSVFMWLFIGVTIGVAFWYVVLPAETVSNLFATQTNTINAINARVTEAFNIDVFARIFFNNVKVLIFCILFSFLYGAGAIFILTWNASVIGTAIGNFVRSSLASYAEMAGFAKATGYFTVIGLGLFRYAIHGIPEILAYFTAGLAGGIISVAVIRHDFRTRKFEHVLLDSADLLMISIAILLLAAILEVGVTPFIFD
ncbi:stage II sporulation protein M [Nanoarchaeota archaeon]